MFDKLFEPIQVGDLEIRNRIVMPPVTENFSTADGQITDRVVDFYRERAKGGLGLICINTFFFPKHPHVPLIPLVVDDKFIPGLRRLTDTIHKYGTKCEIQLAAEDYFQPEGGGPLEYIGPSDVKKKHAKQAPRPMTTEEIKQIINEFVEAAGRCLEAGFDIIQVHGSAGYLHAQFLSSFTNKRTDKYGGAIEGRATILLETIEACQKKFGKDIRLSTRISGEDFVPGGNTLADTTRLLPLLEEAGLKLINVTTGWHESTTPFIAASVPEGKFTYLPEAIKKVVKIPVVGGTRVNHPRLANKLIEEGKVDLVYIARAIIADPEWPMKAKEGHVEDIRPCTVCLLCFEKCLVPEPIACSVNPRAGREGAYRILPAKKAKRVIVVGAGPAGLEAANVAAIRGHKVVLYEQNDTIGGQLINAMQAPYKKGFLRLIRYYGNQLKRNGVEVKLGQKADVKTIIAEKPDEIIVAVGARHVIPDIEGVNGKNVCTPVEVFAGSKEVGGKVVIMGGDMINCDVAEFLLWRGKKVTILDESNRIGSDIIRPNRWVVLQRLRDAGAEMITNVKFNKIDSQGVTVLHDGVTQLYPADSVVVQLSFEPITELAEQLEKHFTNVHRIGDCVSPATVTEAIESGIKVGLQV